MTSYAEVSTAVEAMKLGAFDYISKPFQQEDVLNVIKNAPKQHPHRTTRCLCSEKTTTSSPADNSAPAKVTKAPETDANNPYIEGVSPASKRLSKFINLVAPTDMSVLIMGESGTGKEVVAKSIHLKSERRNKPFIAVDCGAIPKEIASSEFFGHVKGSFTGAISDKKGILKKLMEVPSSSTK